MTDTNNHTVCAGDFTEKSIDDVVKGIIEGIIFIIPETPEMPKDNNRINVNGFTASLLKIGENVEHTKKVGDMGTKDLMVRVNLNIGDQTIEPNKNCSLKFFVYDIATLINSNDAKFFGTPSKCILEYIESVVIDINHRCHGGKLSTDHSRTCLCVNKLNKCIIECKAIVHTVTKDLLSDLVKNNLYDMRSYSSILFTKHGSLSKSIINDPKIIDQLKENVERASDVCDKNPDIIFVESQASDFVLSL